jgi:hypothetical protein
MKPGQTRIVSIALLAATTLVLAACGASDGQPRSTAAAMNAPPVISGIIDQTVEQDSVLSIEFGVQDAETGAGSLKVTAVANDGTLFPADAVLLTGTGATRKLTLMPLEAATGATSISIGVTDADGGYAARTFKVTVNPKSASMRDLALTTFAKGEGDEATSINGVTFQQDADDPKVFAALVPAEAEQ